MVAGTINGMLASLQESAGELRESEQRYRLLAENVTDIIWVVDTELRFKYMSPSITSMLGYNIEEAMNTSLKDVMVPDSFDIAMKAFAEAVAAEKAGQTDSYQSPTLELELRHKDGSTVWLEAKSTAFTDPESQQPNFVGVARDATERRQAREQLQQLYDGERALREQLEEEMRKRIEFTRALVHELKTPITPVLAASELLLEEIKEKRLQGLVQSVERSASNLNRRIDELLDLARGEVEMLGLTLEPVDPLPLLQELNHEVAPVAQRNNQSLDFDLPSSMPPIWADRDRVRQVVLNLLNNAFKFTLAGGKITLKARKQDDNMVVEIKDTGVGISKEDRERLFEPYYRRVDDRERLSGLGLGLALSKNLVELHGGTIWVKSTKGKGSTFSFSIPLADASQIEGGARPRRQ